MRSGLLLLVLLLGPSAASAQAFYLDAVNGDDTNGNGTSAAPWRTLEHASQGVNPVPAGATLYLAPGTYGSGSFDGILSVVGAGASQTRVHSIRMGTLDLWGQLVTFSGLEFDGQGQATGGLSVYIDNQGGVLTTIQDCRFHDCTGEAFFLDGSDTGGGFNAFLQVERCRFERNGVALRLRLAPTDVAGLVYTVVNDVFVGNTSAIQTDWETRGDPIALPDFVGYVTNNTFLAQTGSAIDLRCDAPGCFHGTRLVNNLFASGGGWAIESVSATSDPSIGFQRLASNLFWGNAAGAYSDSQLGAFLTGAEVDTLPSADPLYPSIDADPMLMDPANGDLRLQPGSPAIDRGDTASGPPEDCALAVRPRDGDGDGLPITDIGAYEAKAVPSVVSLRRGDLGRLVPPTPALALFYPFSSANALTPVVKSAFVSGDGDPDAGILSRTSVPLALYQADPVGPLQLRLVKDAINDSVVVTFAP